MCCSEYISGVSNWYSLDVTFLLENTLFEICDGIDRKKFWIVYFLLRF